MRQAVKLISATNPLVATFGARNCYNSFKLSGKSTNQYLKEMKRLIPNHVFIVDEAQYLQRLINKGHESVIEHVNFTFIVNTNRAVLQQIARHRIASYSVRSTRFTLKKEVLKDLDTFLRHNIVFEPYKKDKIDTLIEWYNSFGIIANKRNDDIKEVIPESLMTSIVMTINARSLRNLLKLRTSNHAWKPIREIALLMLKRIYEIKQHEPLFIALFSDIISNTRINIELAKVQADLYLPHDCDYCEHLISFMNLKQKRIENIIGNKPKYFDDKDKNAIENWSKEDCKLVWWMLKSNVDKGFNSSNCPFCLYTLKKEGLSCYSCEYGKNHKICFESESDYNQIIERLINKANTINKLFTYRFYTNIIKLIEGGKNNES